MTRLYERDTYLSCITTDVVSCVPAIGAFDVTLEDELLFPGGGGQPPDRGTIDGQVVLDLKVAEDRVVHRLAEPVSGTVSVKLDLARRLDLSQQHTGQHVISATALNEFKLRTTAFHIGDALSDIEFDTAPLADDQLEALEARVDEVVREARPIRIEKGTVEEIENGVIRSRRIARGVDGLLRIVVIDGFDRNTCGGTHVTNTAQLQLIKFIGTEKLTRAFRVFYATGERVRHLTTQMVRRQEAMTRLLSSGPDQHIELVEKLQLDLRVALKTVEKRTESLAEAIASGLSTTNVAHHHFQEADPAFLRTVAAAYRTACPDGRVLLTAGTQEGPLLIAGPADWVEAHARQVAETLQGRGGGRDGLYQGKATDLSRLAAAAEKLATL